MSLAKHLMPNVSTVGVSKKLKKLLDFYGSDKAKIHNYHLIYSSIFLKNLM